LAPLYVRTKRELKLIRVVVKLKKAVKRKRSEKRIKQGSSRRT
jgi:hypothetical protein